MREPVTLFESNAFTRTHRHRVPFDQISRHHAVNSSSNTTDEHDGGRKNLSVDVYTSKHLVTTGKSMVPYSGRQHLDEIILPAIEKDINRDESRRRRKKKRPSYRKSIYHPTAPNSNHAQDLPELTARGAKHESQQPTPMISDDDTTIIYQRHYAPPPSPSDDTMDQYLFKFEPVNISRPPSRISGKEKEGYIPFRLPALYPSEQTRRLLKNTSSKDVRSTLSNYLRKYY